MLSRRIFRASAFLSAGQMLVKIMDMLAAVVIARFLTPADFGVVMLATGTLVMLRAFTELPVSEALIRNPDVTRTDLDTAFTLTTIRGVIIALIMCAVSVPMAAIFDDERLISLLCVLSLSPIALGLRSPAMVLLSRKIEFRPIATIEALSKLVAFIAAVIFAYFTRSYWALVVSFVVPPLVSLPATYFYAHYRPRLSLENWRSILSFAGWMMLSRAVATANDEMDRFFIGGIVGKSEVGFFSIGRSLSSAVSWAIGMPLMQAFFAGLSTLNHDTGRLFAAYQKGQEILVAGIVPIGFALAVVAEPLVLLALGPDWTPTIYVIQILAPIFALYALTMAVQSLVLAMGQPKQLLIRDSVLFVLGIPTVIIGALSFGLFGAVIARVVLGLIFIAVCLDIVRRITGTSILDQLRPLWRSAASVATMVIAMLVTKAALPSQSTLDLIVSVLGVCCIGAIVYVATHISLWLLAGKPEGPEAFALGILKTIFIQRKKRFEQSTESGA